MAYIMEYKMRMNYLYLKWSIPCLIIVYLMIFWRLHAIETSERLRTIDTMHLRNRNNETRRESFSAKNVKKQKTIISMSVSNRLNATSGHRDDITKTRTAYNSESNKQSDQNSRLLGAVLILAPQRNEITFWHDTPRFCFLMRAVRSVDEFLNQRFGPYPIIILVARDYGLDPRKVDGPYTEQDKALIRSWAPNSTIFFEEINMYSDDALEPETTVEQILKWRKGEDGATEGRDLGYQSMCRAWSGRIQNMDFLKPYTFYLRMDDDSLLTSELPFDPFKEMLAKNLDYIWRRNSFERWGVEQIAKLISEHRELMKNTLFMHSGSYEGLEPYNNFHISRVTFWASPPWQLIWNKMNEKHFFFKFRLGDANVHAAAIMMMPESKVDVWSTFPYAHNSNDMGTFWAPIEWKNECEAALSNFKIIL
jgi:Glycolipid 2-alpha-mannosyltransferase